MAMSDWPALKALTPLFRRSRALSLLQPETPKIRINSAASEAVRRAIRTDAYFIGASIPAEFRSALRGANLHYLVRDCEFRRHQAHRANSRGPHHIDSRAMTPNSRASSPRT